MVPVALYMHYLPEALLTPLAPLVLCAPVAGHVFPATRSFKGGKGIADDVRLPAGAAAILEAGAGVGVYLHLLLDDSADYAEPVPDTRTYFTLPLGMLLMEVPLWICFGTLCMTGMVLVRLHISTEERAELVVHLLWWT